MEVPSVLIDLKSEGDPVNIIRRICHDLIEKGDSTSLALFYDPDYTAHSGSGTYKGYSFLTRYTRQIRKAIPDIEVVSVELLLHTPLAITWQRTLQGTHLHPFKKIPASGKKLRWTEMVVSRFQGNRIAEEWVVSELAGEMQLKLKSNT